jgi:peptide/nickel transport system permease protein
MKKLNLPLVMGVILLMPILTAALVGPLLSPYPVDFTESVRYEDTPEGRVIVAPPSPPSPVYLLGTNKKGNDILTILLHGARWTVFSTTILAFLKLLSGTAWGILRAFRPPNPLATVSAGPMNALPLVVFLYFILAPISKNFPFSPMILVIIFGVVITIFGTPAIAISLEAAAREQMEQEYFTAALAAGASGPYLIRHHLMPFLKERLVILFVTETTLTLNTIGQMGIFSIFLGGTVESFNPPTLNSRLHEWAGLVGQSRFNIFSNQWILLPPLAAYIITVLGLFLLSEGLQRYYHRTYRR